jgi:8-oxo-dGTP pyrophosphatase MutT (NUDIX family)
VIARELLEEAGLQVSVADNGEQAVALVAANAYALVLTDMQMPVLDGLDATADPPAAGQCRPADHCHDRQRLRRGSRPLPGGRHERFHRQADRPRPALRHGAQVVAPERRSADRLPG